MISFKRTATFFLLLTSALFILSTSCKDDTKKTLPPFVDPYPVPSNLKFIGKTHLTGAAALAKVYAEKDLFSGYNKIYVALFDSLTGTRITNSHIRFVPVMDMGSMSHGCPVEDPDENASNGLFKGAVLFSMASGTGMGWTLGLQVHNHLNNLEGEGEIAVEVINPAETRIRSKTTLNDSSKILITLIDPAAPQTGMNDFTVAVHKFNNTTMGYDPVDTYTITINPTMPSMGHGSPNNVDPTSTGNGHYQGKVNFTMSGTWRVDMILKQNTDIADSTTWFEITP